MERLTEKDGTYKELILSDDKQKCYGQNILDNPLTHKLGQLEDIEEELGIDLVTLFKALKNGVIVKNGNKFEKHYIYKCYFNTLWFSQEFETFEGIVYEFNWRNDLVVKSLKYIKNHKSHPLYSRAYNVGLYGGCTLNLKDYGKTWALDKQTLENEELEK